MTIYEFIRELKERFRPYRVVKKLDGRNKLWYIKIYNWKLKEYYWQIPQNSLKDRNKAEQILSNIEKEYVR